MTKNMKQGLLIVYTGDGKGKTTAALGLGLRMMGHGFPVCLIQFIKSGKTCGEHKIIERLAGLYTCHVLGKGFILSDEDREKNRVRAREAWEFSKKVIAEGKFRLIILDEFTYLISLRLLDESEIVDFLVNRPPGVHIVVTGRDAPLSLVDKADLVTEMRELKHQYAQGVKAIKGIEW